jgi:protoheme IX farnesyltransferase
MLPVTHGKAYPRLQVLLYTVILFGASLLPYVIGMSGALYAVAATVLGARYLVHALRIYLAYTDHVARRAFRYSIVYLAALFAALLVDHYALAL